MNRAADENYVGVPVLTEREKEVAGLIAGGLCNKEVGTALNIATKTVQAHRYNLYRKLGAHNVAQMILLAAEAM